jgi:hypothetical protein
MEDCLHDHTKFLVALLMMYTLVNKYDFDFDFENLFFLSDHNGKQEREKRERKIKNTAIQRILKGSLTPCSFRLPARKILTCE